MTPVETPVPQTTGTTQTETTGAGEHDQFLGIEPNLDLGGETETESEQTPEPTETEAEETGETEAGEEAETTTEEAEGGETTEEESDDNWLPTEQEKQFPLETLVEYAQKRGYKWTADQIAKDGDIQKLLKDKLNGDIYIKSLEQQEEPESELDENQFEGTETEEPAATEAITTQTADPRKAYYEKVDSIVSKQLDPAAMSELGKGLLSAMGVDTDTDKLQKLLNNPKLPAEQRTEIQGALQLAQSAGKIGTSIARGGVDLVMTVLPQLLPELIEQIYPGTQARYETGVYAQAWQAVTSAVGKDQKPLYPNMPAFGTKDFQTMARKAERQLGLPPEGLFKMVLTDPKTGQPLSLEQQAQAKYRMIAKVSQGQKITPQAVAAAVQTGKRQATEVAQKRAAGRALGAGQTSRQFDQPHEEDTVLSELRQQIAQQNQDELPVSNYLNKR
jgi:hypothetical protein